MEHNEDDELDYEEDYTEYDSGSKNAAEGETNENSDILRSCDDQCIQLKCPEEEENFLERIYMESEHNEIQNDMKTDGEIQKMEQDKPPSVKQDFSGNNNNSSSSSCCNSNYNGNINYRAKKIFKKKGRPFRRHFKTKKRPGNFLTVGSLLPKWNIDFSTFVRDSVCNSQILNFSQNCYPQLSLLGLAASQLSRNPRQRTNVGYRGLRHENVKTKAIVRNENIKNTQNVNTSNRGFAYNNRICEATKSSENWTLQHQNGKSVESSNCFGKNNNSFLNGLCSPLKDDQKEFLRLKKEARLKRFMNDDVVRNGKKTINLNESEVNDRSNVGEEYLPKLQEQKFTREKSLSVEELQRKNLNLDFDRSVSVEKLNINKESLLKKKNPFADDLSNSDSFLMNTIKQEKDEEVKPESFEKGLFSSESVKNGRSPPVKFVRTVSKSFDELAMRKPTGEASENKEDKSLLSKVFISSTIRRLPLLEANKTSLSRNNELPTQTDIQLTGCIVKVLNIPPSSTTEDILALCDPIGIVMEMKLNLPKENSVVIRFKEPASAENFFNVYHGQKVNNYFLNVIVI